MSEEDLEIPPSNAAFAASTPMMNRGATAGGEEVKQRKIEHVNVALGQDVSAPQRANWSDIHFVHQALPEVDLDQIDTSVTFLGKTLRYPIFMSSLTGGHPDVIHINRNLARAAEHYGLALGVGSQRAAIVNPDLAESYAVTREYAPGAFLIANIGAPQLIPQARHAAFTLEQVQRAIAMIEANALAVHMNSLQEATQAEGDRRAMGEAAALKALAAQIGVPVIAKETGAGVSREQALLLRSCNIAAIDVGGAGGSSMPMLEAARSQARGDEQTMNLGLLFHDWGIPTSISLVEAGVANLPLISTGGVRSGLDVARALALGATLVGIGFPFLKAASESYEKVCELLATIVTEMKVAMQLSGAASIADLRATDVVVTGATREWLTLRGFENDLKEMARRRWQHRDLSSD
ncbi:MAG TPA: type 2 isopentenyl-diphosphate Delta-isomerase [Ktedonobacteraceae bacterium]|nr:type 2 isopentenyl-diphosphate Delta-isomerase [Ktedonobacteraceae bacterium]